MSGRVVPGPRAERMPDPDPLERPLMVCYSFSMRGLLAAAVIFGCAASAAAAGLFDFAKPQNLPPVSHGKWTSYEIYKEKGFSVHLLHVGPGVQRNVFRLEADAVVLALHNERIVKPKPSTEYTKLVRGDFFDLSGGSISGGWVAGRASGVDMLFILRSSEMPKDLDRAAGKKAKAVKSKSESEIYSFDEARAKLGALKGPVRRAEIVGGPGLKVDLLRLTGKAEFKNPEAAASWALFSIEGGASVQATGLKTKLRGNQIFVAARNAAVHVEAIGVKPVYLLMITPVN
jgi:hypothetical protein